MSFAVQAAVTLEECQDLTPQTLRQSLAAVIQSQVETQALTPDEARLQALWVELQVDATIVAETDKAVAYIHKNSGYWERYGSTWGTEAADRFTQDIVNRVFNSPAFKERMEQFITRYGAATQEQLAPVLAQAWEQGHTCLSAFIGARYGRALAYQFKQAGVQGVSKAVKSLGETQLGGVTSHSTALAGVAVLVGKKVLQKMVMNLVARISGGVAQRIGGAIASRFIPVIGWALLAYDFYAAADGILPEVANVLKSPETRSEVLAQLKQGIQEELLAPGKLAEQVAEQVHSQWQEFQQRYQRILALAEQNPEFKRVLGTMLPAQLDRFATVTGILLEAVGTEQTVRYAVGGKVLQLMRLPASVDSALAETKSPDAVLAWYHKVGESDTQMETLVRLGIHRHKQPDDLNLAQINALLAVDDKAAVSTLLTLSAFVLDQALSLPANDLRTLALRSDAAGWQTFAWYRQQLLGNEAARQHFTLTVIKSPHTLALFDAQPTRLMVMNSQDKIMAINEIAGIGSGWFGSLFSGLWVVLKWIMLIVAVLLLIRLWPLLRLLLYPLWVLLRSAFKTPNRIEKLPVPIEKTVE